MATAKDSKTPKFVNLTLRDGQQSTLAQEDWVFDPVNLSKVISASYKSGFSGAEIAGGQSFQIAINCGYNPFTILNAVSHAMEYGGGTLRNDFHLQMLFRGANALGFRHYDKDLIEKTLQEFIKCGIDKIRFFDALNDIDNLKLPESIKGQKGITLEGALCFTHYAEHPDRYTDEYYVNYAQALIAEGYTAIGIKDMSGQLTATRVASLVPALLEKLAPNNIPLSLHIHSTHHENSLGAMQEALKHGVETLETTEGTLAGGSAHHPLSSIDPNLTTNSTEYANLQKTIAKIWPENTDRKDHQIPDELKQQLCAAGVPGGAMPFVIRDLSQQESTIRAKYLSSSHTIDGRSERNLEKFETIIDLFIQELKQVCTDANLPLLVTPTADICCKQAIANLAFGADPYSGTLAGRYLNNSGQPNPDARFTKLILGYYGELKAYAKGIQLHAPQPDIITFFEAHNATQLKTITTHAAESSTGDDLREAQQQAWKLIQKLGASALSFASFDQLTILYALKPFAPQASMDPIHNAVQTYLDRSENSKIDGRGSTFPGYEFLMQPLLCYMRSMFVFNKQLDAQDIVNLPISSFGSIQSSHLYNIYVDLSIWKNVTNLSNHLSLLCSSSHISDQLTQAAQYVSDSLAKLDLRPEKNETASIDQARQKFSSFTIAELFSNLALINAFVNDVAKHATNPSLYADRCLSMEDITKFLNQKPTEADHSPWQKRVRQSLVGKRLRLESDLQKRLEGWRK